MARPAYSSSGFMAFVFSPKKNPQPSGIRRVNLKGVKGGRRRGRLAAFNRMSPVSQQILKESGFREEYLRGEVSLAAARRSLRGTAVQLGIVKPLPGQRTPPPTPIGRSRREDIEARVAYHLKSILAKAGKRYTPGVIDANAKLVPDYAITMVLSMDYPQLATAAAPGSPFEYQRIEDGARYNPLWYGPK